MAAVLPKNYLYYLNLHLKFSTFFYTTQLIDIFSYSRPSISDLKKNLSYEEGNIVVYTYHNVFFQKRFFFFVPLSGEGCLSKDSLNSIAELFTNAGWLEREASELSGFMYFNKKDTRNLMLPYSDNSQPLQKNFPSIGLKEIFYDLQSDYLIQQPVSVQF
jgi:NADH:ubiquinone oxidoreductase subunit C